MKQVRIVIHGRVQGVFFRDTANGAANQMGIKGHVRNNPDGTVEIVAQGSEEQIKEFLEFCCKGPKQAEVTNVDIEEQDVEKFDEFEIRY